MKIICRFNTKEDLEQFNSKNGLSLTDLVKEYDFNTNKAVYKRPSRTKQPTITSYDRYMEYWNYMPKYESENESVYAKITFDVDLENASDIFEQNITDKTKSIRFPKLVAGKNSQYRVIGGELEPQYPIYVISKGRPTLCTTSIYLTNMEQFHYVVVEPQEYSDYVKELENKYCVILKLDMKYKDEYDCFSDLGNTQSTGPGPARNFCWEHSMANGFKWHWVFDDNANEGFFLFSKNRKLKARTNTIFRTCEDFVNRFDNVAIAGLNYSKFCLENSKYPPFTTNTRIYSFLLIRNDIPYRWRGRYNEDTDLSLRVLKDGWCTIQFNHILAGKITTQRIKGGNTNEFYEKEGTYNKSKMLEDMHPDVAKVVWKFNRWHHEVDYSKFTQPLRYKENTTYPNENNGYGMYVVKSLDKNTKDTRKELEQNYKDNILEYV